MLVFILGSTLLFLNFGRIPSEKCSFDYKSSFPIIFDTLSSPDLLRKRKLISKADYNILYLGYEKDSILVQYDTCLYRRNTRFNSIYDHSKMYYEAEIQFIVDTSQKIKENAGIEMDELFDYDFDAEPKYFSAYPVIIKNLEKKPIIIGKTGLGEEIPLILEAKNQKGDWQAIEEEFIPICGMGILPIILEPQQIIVTGVIIYQGSFKTELRLKYGKIYSKTFHGSINPSQFNSIFK